MLGAQLLKILKEEPDFGPQVMEILKRTPLWDFPHGPWKPLKVVILSKLGAGEKASTLLLLRQSDDELTVHPGAQM